MKRSGWKWEKCGLCHDVPFCWAGGMASESEMYVFLILKNHICLYSTLNIIYVNNSSFGLKCPDSDTSYFKIILTTLSTNDGDTSSQ